MTNETRNGRGRIIALVSTRRETKLQSLTALRAYWNTLSPAPGVVPPRIAVQPRAIEDALHAAFLCERNEAGTVGFRVAGRNLVDALGTEPRNLPLAALFAVEEKMAALQLIETVFSAPAILEIDLVADGAEAHLLIMPLTDYLGRITMALGGFSCEGDAPGMPGRFRIAGKSLTMLNGGTVTQPGCFSIDGLAAAAEAPAPFRGAPRLVHSRDE